MKSGTWSICWFSTMKNKFLHVPEMKANISFHNYFNESYIVHIALEFAHRKTAFASGTKMTDKELQINK